MSEEIKFGTDGWRGIIGRDFNLENVQVVAQGLADYLKRDAKKKSVAVGYDTRRLSKEAAGLISRILAGNGIKTILSSSPLPTQTISYTVRIFNCAAGIMVTASHNPASFNGIKIKGAFGGPVEKDVTDRIERLIFKNKPLKISLSQAREKHLLKIANLIPAYLKFVKSYLDMPLLKKGRLKVLVDSMHGTANSYIAAVLKGSKFRITTIHKRPDPSFGGIKPEPISSCLKEASLLMREGSFDVGLATDGDADRLAALDEKGNFVNPQQILSLLLLHLIRYRKLKGAVAKNIAGTSLIERIAAKYKLKVYETPVGFKHISGLMQRKNILIGGEEAGGIGFKDYLPERDGILGGLLLLEMMLVQEKSLKSLLEDMEDEFGSYFYLRKDIKCLLHDKNKIKTKLDKLRKKKTFLSKKITLIKDYDGLKFYLEDESWILFRLSGTEPLLRIYAESSTLLQTKRLIAQGGKIVRG